MQKYNKNQENKTHNNKKIPRGDKTQNKTKQKSRKKRVKW